MKAATKKKWIKALRSGNYAQGEGDLRYKDYITGELSYCCLGVLADILPNAEFDDDGMCRLKSLSGRKNAGRDDQLTRSLAINVGITQKNMNLLIDLNDKRNLDFPTLSNIIDQMDI